MCQKVVDQAIGYLRNLGGDASESGLTNSKPHSNLAFTPFTPLFNGCVNSGFGERLDPINPSGQKVFHHGIDIRGPDGESNWGAQVRATRSGLVQASGWQNGKQGPGDVGFGRRVWIQDGTNVWHVYAHPKVELSTTADDPPWRGNIDPDIGAAWPRWRWERRMRR